MLTIPDFQSLTDGLRTCSAGDVERALQVRRPTLRDLSALLSPAADPFLPQMARRSQKLTLQRFGRTTQIYGPIYLSNYCTNRCDYC